VLAWMWLVAGAVAASPEADVVISWRTATCEDEVIRREAESRAAQSCPASAVDAVTWQYRESSRATGCDLWLHVWCVPPATVPGYRPAGQVVVPTLYLDKGFKGLALALREGSYPLAGLPLVSGGDWNDKASSVRVPAGWTLRLCEEPGGSGRCSDLTGEVADLGSVVVGNDSATSAEVVRGSLAPLLACPRAFEHDSFGGQSLDLCQSMPDLGGGSFNDKFSSVIVPEGWVVLLCDKPNGGAPCKELAADEPRLGNTSVGADKVSSVEVVKRP
jgi:hypothetical protein